MKKFTAYLGLIILFATGIAVGIAGHSAWMKASVHRFEKRGPSLSHSKIMKRMTERLRLTPEQREQIALILKTSHEKSDATHKAHRKENNLNKRETIQLVQKVLTKKQRDKFRKALKAHFDEMKKLSEQRQQNAGSPPPPPPPKPKTDDASADNAPEPSASDAKQNAADAETA